MAINWDKLVRDLDKNMDALNKNKKISADTLITFKQLEKKLKKLIDDSNKTIGKEKV